MLARTHTIFSTFTIGCGMNCWSEATRRRTFSTPFWSAAVKFVWRSVQSMEEIIFSNSICTPENQLRLQEFWNKRGWCLIIENSPSLLLGFILPCLSIRPCLSILPCLSSCEWIFRCFSNHIFHIFNHIYGFKNLKFEFSVKTLSWKKKMSSNWILAVVDCFLLGVTHL